MEIGCTTLGITNTRLLFHFTPPPHPHTHTVHLYLLRIKHLQCLAIQSNCDLFNFQHEKYIPTAYPTLIPPAIFPPRSVFHYILWTVSHILDVLKPPENWCCLYDKPSWISSAANFLGPRGNFFLSPAAVAINALKLKCTDCFLRAHSNSLYSFSVSHNSLTLVGVPKFKMYSIRVFFQRIFFIYIYIYIYHKHQYWKQNEGFFFFFAVLLASLKSHFFLLATLSLTNGTGGTCDKVLRTTRISLNLLFTIFFTEFSFMCVQYFDSCILLSVTGNLKQTVTTVARQL